AHALKAGVEIFRDQENDLFSGPQQRPNYDFRNLFDFAADTPLVENNVNYDLRDGTPSFQDVQYRVTTFGFFAQDNWKVKKNFSLNLGLRWDFSSNPNEKNGRMSNVVLGSGSNFQQKIANASVKIVPELFETHRIGYFAPRLSFAWTPWGFDSRISIRGGMGDFMQRWPNIAPTRPGVLASGKLLPSSPRSPPVSTIQPARSRSTDFASSTWRPSIASSPRGYGSASMSAAAPSGRGLASEEPPPISGMLIQSTDSSEFSTPSLRTGFWRQTTLARRPSTFQ